MAGITAEQLNEMRDKICKKAVQISATMDHKNWYPCGNAHLVVKGTSPLVKAIKLNPNCGMYLVKATPGYWVSVRVPESDAFECQNMDYRIAVNEAFKDIVKEYGIESYVGSYID